LDCSWEDMMNGLWIEYRLVLYTLCYSYRTSIVHGSRHTLTCKVICLMFTLSFSLWLSVCTQNWVVGVDHTRQGHRFLVRIGPVLHCRRQHSCCSCSNPAVVILLYARSKVYVNSHAAALPYVNPCLIPVPWGVLSLLANGSWPMGSPVYPRRNGRVDIPEVI